MKLTRTLLIGTIVVASQSISQANQNWDGDNAVGNFSYNNNWYGDNQPEWGSGNLYFSYRNNSSQTSLYFDYGDWVNTNDIIWESTFGAGLPLNGNDNGKGIRFNQRLVNNSSYSQTIGSSMNLSAAKHGASQIELNPVNGDLTLNGAIFNDNSKAYQVYGNNGKTLILNTTLGVGGTASNVSFTVIQNSIVVMNSGQNYTGTTSVTAGKLLVNGDNSSATGAVTVDSGATLGGYGTVGGATTISGTHNVSDSGSDRTQNFSGDLTYNSGSIFNWDLNSPTTNPGVSSNEGSYDKVVAGGALGGTSRFDVILDSGDSFADAFWDTNKSWTDIFTKGGGSTLASIFTTFGGTDIATDGKVTSGGSLRGQFTFTDDTLNWTAVPEPTNFLVGLLLVAGLLRRKRGDASKICLAR